MDRVKHKQWIGAGYGRLQESRLCLGENLDDAMSMSWTLQREVQHLLKVLSSDEEVGMLTPEQVHDLVRHAESLTDFAEHVRHHAVSMREAAFHVIVRLNELHGELKVREERERDG